MGQVISFQQARAAREARHRSFNPFGLILYAAVFGCLLIWIFVIRSF